MSWSNFVRIFDFGGQWGRNTARIISGNEAIATVKKIESILADGITVLQSHERVLSQSQYKSFSIKHRRLVLRVVEVKQDIHSQEERGIFSGDPAGGQRSRTDRQVEHLLSDVQTYRRDVLTASRRAEAEEEGQFDNFHAANLSQAQEISSVPATTWYSVITPAPSSVDTLTESDSDASTLVGREPFLAIAHVRETKPTLGGVKSPEDDAYRRILILEQNDKRAFMIDPNPCYLDKDSEPLNEESLREMSRAGELLLKAAGSDDLKGFEVIGNYEEPTWVNIISETLGKLATGGAVNML